MKTITIINFNQSKQSEVLNYIEQARVLNNLYRLMIGNIKQLYVRYKNIIYQVKTNKQEYGYYMNENLFPVFEIFNSLNCKSLLDLGSGPGLMLKALKQVFNDCNFVGYDNEKIFVEDSKKLFYTNVQQKNILTLKKEDVNDFEVLYFYEPFCTPYNLKNIKCEKFIKNLSKIMYVGQYIIYMPAGSIRHYLDNPKYGFEFILSHKGVLLYQYVGLTKN